MISRTCNSRPKIEANPAMPPNNPYPNSRPNRPAPRKPAARPPSSPRPPNKPALGAVRARPTLEGCVIERWIGAAVGAVAVLGGAEYVRVPRLPAEEPPRGRASASAVTKTNAAAITINAANQRGRNMAYLPDNLPATT